MDKSQLYGKILPEPKYDLKSNNTFDLSVKKKSSLSETISANLNINYASQLMEIDNIATEGVELLGPNDEPSQIFNAALEDDDEIKEILNDPNYMHLRVPLLMSRNKPHFFSIIEESNKRAEQHKVIENSSLGTWLTALTVDPFNAVTIVLPILRSKTVYEAIVKSALMTAGTVGPLEMSRVYADPTVTPMQGVQTTAGAMLFTSVLSGVGRGITNFATSRARANIEKQVTDEMVAIGKFADEPVFRDIEGNLHGRIGAKQVVMPDGQTTKTQYSVMRDGKRVNVEIDDVPLIKNPESIDTSGNGKFLSTYLFKAIPTPEKRLLMNSKISNSTKSIMNRLGSALAFKLEKNAKGIASDFSVHIKANTEHGKWVKVHDKLLDIYTNNTTRTVTKVLDYRLRGAKEFDAFIAGANRRLVMNDYEGATKGELEAIDLLKSFWEDWERKLIDVNMIGTNKGLKREIIRLENHIKELEARPAIKGDLDFNKIQIERYKGKISLLKEDLKNPLESAKPMGELNFYARYYNHDKIRANREKFTGIIAEHFRQNPYVYKNGKKELLPYDEKSIQKRAKDTVSKILNETDGNMDQSFAGYNSKHTRHRNLDIPNSKVWEFIEQNPITVMKNYTSRVAPEYHFRKEFGGRDIDEVLDFVYNDVAKTAGLKTAQASVRDISHMYDRVVGNIIKNPSALNQKVRQVLNDFAGLTYLGSAGFATLTDYAAILMQRELGAFLKFGFSVLDSTQLKLGAKEGRYAGEALDIMMQMEGLRLIDDLSARAIDRGMYSKVMGKAKQLFYATNLLGPATNIAKRFEAILRQHQIIEDSLAIYNNKASKQTREMMAKYGLGQKEIKEIAEKAPFQREGKGIYLANTDEWLQSGVSRETLDKFQYSMNAGIFNTVIMSSPADKPIMMDGVFYVPWRVAKFVPGMKEDKRVRGYSRIENGIMNLPFAFMSYSFGAANKITAAMAQNTLKNKAMGTVAAMGLAYMGLQLRYRNRPYVLENMSTQDKILRTFDYSGLAAIYSDMFYRGLSIGVNTGMTDSPPFKPKYISPDAEERPMDAALEILGAPASLFWEYKRGVEDFFAGDVNDGVKRFQQNFPFAKIWWMENNMKDIGRVIGRW
tara:strand:+ start:1743 stop:5087 length:3345 start_codon:yes stop_codon:yes gene_type:complete